MVTQTKIVSDSATPWTTVCQASLSITISRFCPNSCPLSLWSYLTILISVASFLPSIFPSIRVFSNEEALCIRWPKYGSFSISSSMNIQGWFPLELTGLISLQSNRLSRVFQTTIQRNQLFGLQPSFWSTLTFMHDYWRNHSCDYVHFCQQSNVSTF